MAKLTYVKIFFDQFDALEPLTDEETGRLFRALRRYAQYKETPTLAGNERFLWPMLKNAQDRAEAAYSEMLQKASEAGKRGGRPSKKVAFSEKGTISPKGNAFSEKGENPIEEESEEESEEEGTTTPYNPPKGENGSSGGAYLENVLGRLTSNQREELKAFELPDEVIEYAADEAAANGKPNWAYARSILADCKKRGVCTAEEAKTRRENSWTSAGLHPWLDE